MNLTIIVTQNCNMDCSYCYETKKNRAASMSEDVLRKTVGFIMQEYRANPGKRMSINFCGGEPLTEFDKIRFVVESIQAQTQPAHAQPVQYDISTNGTLLDDRIIDYLRRHNFSYYIGLDGAKESHDRNRRLCGANKNSFDSVSANIRRLLARGVQAAQIVLNLVVADNNVESLVDNVVFLGQIASGLKLSMNIAYNLKWDQGALEVLDRNIGGLVEFYKRRTLEDPKFSIKFVDDRVGRLLYPRQVEPSGMCGAARGCLTVLTDGNIIGCTTLAYCKEENDDIVIGDVGAGISALKKSAFRNLIDAIDHDECKGCGFFPVCANYCVANNLVGSGTMTKISRSICETEKVVNARFAGLIKSWRRDRPDFLVARYGDAARRPAS